MSKPDFLSSDDSDSRSQTSPMVETTSPGVSPNTINSQASSNYLTTAMLLGNQGCGYFGQRLSNHLQMQRNIEQTDQSQNNHQRSTHTGSNAPTSLFTIDSILAPKPSAVSPSFKIIKSESPVSISPPATSPVRPQRVPAILHHPGLHHLGHLAAAAATSFGSTTDFLGKEIFLYFLLY